MRGGRRYGGGKACWICFDKGDEGMGMGARLRWMKTALGRGHGFWGVWTRLSVGSGWRQGLSWGTMAMADCSSTDTGERTSLSGASCRGHLLGATATTTTHDGRSTTTIRQREKWHWPELRRCYPALQIHHQPPAARPSPGPRHEAPWPGSTQIPGVPSSTAGPSDALIGSSGGQASPPAGVAKAASA